MDRFVINGGNRIEGEIKIDGAKNSVLPILAATIINGGESVIHNVPDLKDVETLSGVLKSIGCKCFFENNTMIIKSDNLLDISIPEKPVREMRSSIILLGAMIARCGQAKISYPGGYAYIPYPLPLYFLIISINALTSLGSMPAFCISFAT
ncbi:MAG: hypothetical protein WBL93_09090 [Lutisporaceae bacterium]